MCLLNKEIHKFALKHQQDEGLKDLNEAQVRNTIINPLLRILGWDDGSVTVEAATGIFHSVKHADYVLRCKGTQTPFAALEVKRPSFPLYNPKECPQEAKREMEKWLCQSLNYSLLLGTEFTVLSNGPQWLVLETFEPGVSVFERAVLWFPSFLHIADHADIFALISEASVQDGDFHNFVHIQKQKHTAGHFCYLNKEGVDDLCRQFYIEVCNTSDYHTKVLNLLRHLRETNALSASLSPYEKEFTYVAEQFSLIEDDEQYLSFESIGSDSIRMNMRKTKGTLWPYPTKVGRFSHIGIAMRGIVKFRVFGQWYTKNYLRPHAVSIVGSNLGSSMNKLA